MIKKTFTLAGFTALFFAHAQDFSTIKNSADVYTASMPGTSKYNAMAGSMGALGGDISTINSNPAGIGVAIASDISATLQIQNNKNTSSLFGTSNSYSTKATDLGQIGAIVSFVVRGNSPWKFVNIGINSSSKSIEDYSESAGANNIKLAIDGDALKFIRHAYDRTGTVSKIGIAVGGNYDNRIFVGAGMSIHGTMMDQSDAAEMAFARVGTSESFFKQYTPYHEESAGFSANIGVIGKVNNQFRLGASLESPTFWNIDRTYRYYDKFDSNDDGDFSETRTLRTPMKATLSAAFVPNKNLAVNLDYSIGLTKPRYTGGDSGLQKEFDAFYSSNSKNVSEVKLGAEYRIQKFRIRGGYGFATNPFAATTFATLGSNGTVASQSYNDMYAGKKSTVGVGLGYDFKSFYIDAAYQNISSTYSSPFLRGNASASSQYYSANAFFANDNPLVASVKNTKNNFSITAGWKF